jgi:hypothetical protein
MTAIHLGVNVYAWSQESQNRLLVGWLAPLVEQLRAEPARARFWFDRFNARGPHLIVLFTIPADVRKSVARTVAAGLDDWTTASTADRPLGGSGVDEAERFHQAVRGAVMCEADREEGLAEEGSYRLFEQPADEYPFHLTGALPPWVADELWMRVDELSLWTIGCIALNRERPPMATAIRWLASFEQELRRQDSRAESFWRFYAGTLLFGLPRRIADDEEGVLRALPRAVGTKNGGVFARIWDEMAGERGFGPDLAMLVQTLLAAAERLPKAAWALPRELVHWTLKQLCLPVDAEIPLILYAWWRSLSRENGA